MEKPAGNGFPELLMLMAAIFDMDGVIVDSHAAHSRTWKRLLTSLDKPVSDADLEFVREGRRKQEILRHFLGDLTDQQLLAFGRMKDLLFKDEVKNVKPVPGSQLFLEDLKRTGLPVALASCGGAKRVHGLLSHLRLSSYFMAVVTGDEVAVGKPHPEIFHKAAQRLHAHPAESVVFEDSVCGVQAAKAAGMKCVGIADRGRATALLEAGAECVLPDFSGVSWINVQKLLARSGKQRYEHRPYSARI
jgi:beta-phosphoglucomutase